jgi:hypothetical protein
MTRTGTMAPRVYATGDTGMRTRLHRLVQIASLACLAAIVLTVPPVMGQPNDDSRTGANLPNPLICESHGSIVEGSEGTKSHDPVAWKEADLRAMAAQERAKDEIRARTPKLECQKPCELFLGGASWQTENKDSGVTWRWRVDYLCSKPPPPPVINRTMPPQGSSSTARDGGGGGSSSSGGAESPPDYVLSALTTRCKPCQSIVDRIKEAAADEAKLEQRDRAVQGKLKAAMLLNNAAEANALEAEAAQIASQLAQDRTFIKVMMQNLEDCEHKKCPQQTNENRVNPEFPFTHTGRPTTGYYPPDTGGTTTPSGNGSAPAAPASPAGSSKGDLTVPPPNRSHRSTIVRGRSIIVGGGNENPTAPPPSQVGGEGGSNPTSPPPSQAGGGAGSGCPGSGQCESVHSSVPARVAQGTITPVSFTALGGTTAINPYFVGQVTKVTFVNQSLQDLPNGSVRSNLDEKPDAVRLTIDDAANIGGVVIAGTAGTVVMLLKSAHASPVAAQANTNTLVPLRGQLMIGNGNVNDTLLTPPGAVNQSAAPASQSVTIAGQPAQTVAVRSNAIAFQASNVPPAQTGSEPVTLNGSALQNVPCWSYQVSVQPVTAVGETVPVMVQVMGLGSSDTVTFQFTPQPGQQITPLTATITGSQASAPIPVAQLSSDRPGPQAFDVVATKTP